MELWFTEKHTEHVKFSIQVDKPVLRTLHALYVSP